MGILVRSRAILEVHLRIVKSRRVVLEAFYEAYSIKSREYFSIASLAS